MRVEILSIGTELLTGTIVNTNSAYIAEQCEIAGLEIIRHSCVGDDLHQITQILLEITVRADIVIVTGGLGPTLDDLSREAAANATNAKLELYPDALTAIEEMFTKRSRNMPEGNRKQAYFPKNSEYLPNPIGTAPGFALRINQTDFYFMPGVPIEMQKMLNEQVFPRIFEKSNNGELNKLSILTLKTLGLSEATIGQYLENIGKNYPQINFGTRANFPEVEVKLYVRNNHLQNYNNLLLEAKNAVISAMGDWIFSDDNNSMEKIVAELLVAADHSLSICECPSGGIISDWLTNVPDSPKFLFSSCVMNPKKIHLLVNDNLTTMNTLELVEKLTEKIQKQNKTTYSLVIYGACTEQEEHLLNVPTGSAYIAIATESRMNIYRCELSFGGQHYRKLLFATLSLDLLRRQLLNLAPLNEIFGKTLTHVIQSCSPDEIRDVK